MLNTLKRGSQWFALWLLLVLLAGVVVYQAFSTIMLGGIALVDSPYRPLYWNSARLTWLGRFVSFLLGISWIFFMSMLDYQMRQWEKRNMLTQRALRWAGILIGIALFWFLLAQLVVLL